MMGTLAAVLAGRGIKTHKGLFRADVVGDIEDINGVLKITRIRVNYTLKVPSEKRNEAMDAFGSYLERCPGAQSVIKCITLEHHLKMEDL